jgi:hypothetical protein
MESGLSLLTMSAVFARVTRLRGFERESESKRVEGVAQSLLAATLRMVLYE